MNLKDNMIFKQLGLLEFKKRCSKCGEYKSYTDFYKYSRIGRKKDIKYNCRFCESELAKIYYQRNKEKVLRKCKERNSKMEVKYSKFIYKLKYEYNISIGQYQEKLKSQNSKCKICGYEFKSEYGGDIAIDHCHSTGKVRGLLCMECNSGIGFLKDSKKILLNAIKYLEESQDG